MHNGNVLTIEQIQRVAPSVFATAPHESRGKNYRFFPTFTVLEAMMKEGFMPVKAAQSRTRIEGKENFTRHMLRFRHSDLMETRALAVGDEIPEITLFNAHDGTASYQIDMGMWRKACSNGLMVKSSNISSIRVRHSGRENLIDDVIEGSYEIIKEAPKAIAQIEQFKGITLERREQEIFADAALELRGTSLEVRPDHLLTARRGADAANENGGRDLWKTMNVVQEHLIRGGASARGANGQRNTLRAVNSVDGDMKLNRALWQLTEQMATLKAA